MSKNWIVGLGDNGTLDTVMIVRVPKKDGTFLDETVVFNSEDVERDSDGIITDEELERLEKEAIEEVEERIQALNEEAQDARNGRD